MNNTSKLIRERRFMARLILRISIGLCLLLIIVGLAMFVANNGTRAPLSPYGRISEILARMLRGGTDLQSGSFLIGGIVVLLFTPIARLIGGIVISARAHDRLYTIIGLVVLALIVGGMLIGQATA